jgi:hypothetical protein
MVYQPLPAVEKVAGGKSFYNEKLLKWFFFAGQSAITTRLRPVSLAL